MALIQVRRGSTAAWAAANPVLADGEPGFALPDGPLKVGNGVDPWLSLPEAEGGGLSEADADARYVPFAALAKNPDSLIAGAITRDANGAATSAPVVWPDGAPGIYTGTPSASFPGAIDSYAITYGSPVTKTYTQPAVTRNADGAATAVPAIVVS